jgi:hypothetical protein
MNDIKRLAGKTIITTYGLVGKVLAFDDDSGSYIILRNDRSTGWTPGRRATLAIERDTGAYNPRELHNRCWYVPVELMTGVMVPVADFTHPVVVEAKAVPATPVEPTAPMTSEVLKMLRKKGDVTTIEAQGVLRCRSLSKRISELKGLGHRINRTLHEDHTGQRYARYTLAA